MKKLNKIIPIILSTILLFTPCYAIAAPDNLEENNLTNETGSSEENNTSEETGSSEENNTNGENSSTETTPVEEEKNPLENVEIALNQKELELKTNTEVSLTATITPNDSNLEIEWSSSDETIATVDSNGKVTTKNRAATVTITATIKNSNDKKASCTIKVTRPVGKDASLKSLTISNGTLDKEFKSDILEYSVTVDKNVSKLEFEYELTDSNAKFFGPSNKNIKNGDKLELKIIAEDETTNRTYTLSIIKEETSLNLKKLEINGYALNEVFDPEITEYTASIPYEIETISVSATPEDNKATVKPSGLTNLKVGVNTVKITVTDENENSKVYKIKVTRETEVSVEENPTSIITSNDNEKPTSSITSPINEINHTENNNFIKYAVVSLACLILFAIGGIGIYFYLKTSPKKLKKELNNIKKEEMETPIIETENKKPEPSSSIVEVMQENLIETREFKKEDLQVNSKPEDLFDEEDV